LQSHTHLEKPEFPGGQAAKFFSQRLRAGDSMDGIVACIDWFFEHWLSSNGAGNFGHFAQKYNGIAKAVIEHEQVQNRA
jgi:hypothetical protein